MKKTFKWTVEFAVTENWVADGFEITAESAKDMIENALPYAYESETKARVLKAPDKHSILRAQGYAVDDSAKA